MIDDEPKDRGRDEDYDRDMKEMAREALGMPPRCTTHHNACACRDWVLRVERDRLAADLRNAKSENEHAVLALKEALADRARHVRAIDAAKSVFAETPVRALAACYVAFQVFEDAVQEYREAT